MILPTNLHRFSKLHDKSEHGYKSGPPAPREIMRIIVSKQRSIFEKVAPHIFNRHLHVNLVTSAVLCSPLLSEQYGSAVVQRFVSLRAAASSNFARMKSPHPCCHALSVSLFSFPLFVRLYYNNADISATPLRINTCFR